MSKRQARSTAAAIHKQVNGERAMRDLPSLTGKGELAAAAESYARVMANKRKMGHNVDGSSPTMRASGFAGVCENVAKIHGTNQSPHSIAGKAVGMWMSSGGHRQNILRKRSVYSGVGVWLSGGTAWICHLFASRRSVVGVVAETATNVVPR